MKTILILNSHNENRGDEAAVKSMVDELMSIYPDADIYISNNGITPYPNMPRNVKQIARFPKCGSLVHKIEFFAVIVSKGNLIFTAEAKEFVKVLRRADLVIHAPGGPAIGDIYSGDELQYLLRLDFVHRMGKKYMFYAPSMGPFYKKNNDRLRKRVLKGAEKIVLRDPISNQYLKEYMPEIETVQAMDSALQHDLNEEYNEKKFKEYASLKKFIEQHGRCIGITVTDLTWHPAYKKYISKDAIYDIFNEFIENRIREGFGIVFIPQLYGRSDDYSLMTSFMRNEHTFIVNDGKNRNKGDSCYESEKDTYDSYFQQYVIGKMCSVVGMRYHSNIFSAKVGTPFISISYEQKMAGFMQSLGLSDYCIDIGELSIERLEDRFRFMMENYTEYKCFLRNKHEIMKMEARKATEAVEEILSKS